ncbi:MAG: HAD-IC family P-type ATPase, partial [Acetobacter sp.]|uniref:cation-translocating P-type ATPase n=2 Tax=Acetobacter sp. TaxID=440 RepID=UPI0039EC2247
SGQSPSGQSPSSHPPSGPAAPDVQRAAEKAGAQAVGLVFAGTLVVRGQGMAEVVATGRASEIGKIGASLEGIGQEAPHLARQTGHLARTLALVGLGVSAVFTLLDGVLRGAWLEALLGGVALSMSLLPEELPLVLTVFLVMGAWRITRAGVLTRRAAAIESLGAASVLCTDKTGTLTRNQMTIVELHSGTDMTPLPLPASAPMPDAAPQTGAPHAGTPHAGALQRNIPQKSGQPDNLPDSPSNSPPGNQSDNPPDNQQGRPTLETRPETHAQPPAAAGTPDTPARQMIEIGRLACQPEPFDPMEKAFHDLAQAHRPAPGATPPAELVHTYPLAPDLLAMSNVWRMADGTMLVATKGAPETIAGLCGLAPAAHAALRAATDDMAARGIRVLGLAQATLPAALPAHLPASQQELGLVFVGLVGLSDPLRDTVPAAVRECRAAGVRVVMITGDHPTTARAIAAQAGIETRHILSGHELESMSEDTLAAKVRHVTIFARIRPEQKLRIVRALRSLGDVVAMTGDGVNDAPALKAADIGIAMGGRGSDVAREASALVLLHDDFGSIVQTIRLGRRIYDNIHKALGFVLAVHVPIAGLAILPLLTGQPLILMPLHIAFLEIIIDPACSIAFEAEPEEHDLMTRPPRNPAAPLFSRELVAWSMVQGVTVFIAVACLLLVAVRRGMPEAETRSLVFVTLVMGDIVLILVNRSFSTSLVRAFLRPNSVLGLILALDLGLLVVILLPTPLRGLLRMGPLGVLDIGLSLTAAAIVMCALEGLKRFWRKALRS